MKRMLIAAHAHFASGLGSALSLIMGGREDITCIDAFVTDTPLEEQITSFIQSLQPDDQVLIVTDAFFGSVNQKLVEKHIPNSLTVTGANLPLALELVNLLDSKTPFTAEQLRDAIKQAKGQVLLVGDLAPAGVDDDFDF